MLKDLNVNYKQWEVKLTNKLDLFSKKNKNKNNNN